MANRAISVALLLSSLPMAGCGTVVNLLPSCPQDGGKTPFGGVKHDVSCMKQAANGEIGSKAQCQSQTQQYPPVAVMFFCAADLPLSAIGDLVTWPYTATYTYINQPIPAQPIKWTPVPPVPQGTLQSQPQPQSQSQPQPQPQSQSQLQPQTTP